MSARTRRREHEWLTPRFEDGWAEVRYCLSRFVERERRAALNSYISPSSKTEAEIRRDWMQADRDGFELWLRARRALGLEGA